MATRWCAAAALLVLGSTFTQAAYIVQHRLTSPVDAPWTTRGRLIPIDAENHTLVPNDASNLDLPPGLDPRQVRYEVSVVQEAGQGPAAVAIDRPLCSLNPPTYGPAVLTDTLLLHLRADSSLVGLSWDGLKGCSSGSTASLEGIGKALQRVGRWKTKVAVRHIAAVDLPPLPPPPASLAQAYMPDGTLKPPPPAERSFIQKYGLFIAPIVLLLLLGGPDDKPRAREPARR